MVLKQFPDIAFVRRLKNDSTKHADTWMNVALNIRCREVSRTGVESPFSLFVNKSGFSYCKVNKTRYRIGTDAFLLTQPGEIYDLLIDNLDQTEICNIHINRDYFCLIAHSLMNTSNVLLTDPEAQCDQKFKLFTQLYSKDEMMNRLVTRLSTIPANDTQSFDEILSGIVEHLLLSNEQVRKKIAALPFLTTAVRLDIYKRLSQARDYLYSNYSKPVELDELCKEIGMSKFHFIRMFKAFYKATPYQYLSGIRMEKAAGLLKDTQKPVYEIADDLGFDYPNSFIKAFHKSYGHSPLRYRNQ